MTNRPLFGLVLWTVMESANLSETNQKINQPTNQSINQSAKQTCGEHILEPISAPSPEQNGNACTSHTL